MATRSSVRWSGVLERCVGAVCWSGVLERCVGAVCWSGVLERCVGAVCIYVYARDSDDY